jgi:hypothetical protein
MNNQKDQLQKQLSLQSGIQDIDEQQLEAVTGGAGCCGLVNAIKGMFSSKPKNDPTKNPFYDPNWKPPTSPPSASYKQDEVGNPVLKKGLGDSTTRISQQDSKIQTIYEPR